MRVTNGQRMIGMMAGIALATLVLWPAMADAVWVPPAVRCVRKPPLVPPLPPPCQIAHATWDEAYAAANPGDTIVLMQGMAAARLRVGKRLIIKTENGFRLSDATLTPDRDAYVVHVINGGQGTDLRMKVDVTATAGVPRSAGAIFLEFDSDVLPGTAVSGPGRTTDTVGIRVNRGTGSKTMRVMGASWDPVSVTGFGTGIFVDNPSFHVTSYIKAEGNGIGLRQRWGRGQNFYGVWRNNNVAIQMEGVNHNDTNSHTFECNGIALRSLRADLPNPATGYRVNGPHLEYNFHVVKTCGGVDVEVEVSPGVFVDDRDLPPGHKGARTLDPGFHIQYSTRKVDGVLLPTWITPGVPAP
jgi:hypothetical protein